MVVQLVESWEASLTAHRTRDYSGALVRFDVGLEGSHISDVSLTRNTTKLCLKCSHNPTRPRMLVQRVNGIEGLHAAKALQMKSRAGHHLKMFAKFMLSCAQVCQINVVRGKCLHTSITSKNPFTMHMTISERCVNVYLIPRIVTHLSTMRKSQIKSDCTFKNTLFLYRSLLCFFVRNLRTFKEILKVF